MKSIFVEQATKKNTIKSVFKKVEQKDNKIIINQDVNKLSFKKKVKLTQNIKKILQKEKCRQIVLENSLKQKVEFTNLIYGENINICSKSWLFKQLANRVIEEILTKKQWNKENTDLYVCVNDVDLLIENYIYEFARSFKRLTIITNHIEKFKIIEKKLYEEDGIMINVTNNKRKSLLKAELILNFDFPKELLNQFAIFDNSIIINIEGDMKIRKKRFCGEIINDINIKLAEDEENEKLVNLIKENHLENYDIRDICQAIETIPKVNFVMSDLENC